VLECAPRSVEEIVMKKHDKPALRNWTAAANPLLRKGGVHRKSRKAERTGAKQDLRRDSRRGFDPSMRVRGAITQATNELQS
jgi:hypothetical protein